MFYLILLLVLAVMAVVVAMGLVFWPFGLVAMVVVWGAFGYEVWKGNRGKND